MGRAPLGPEGRAVRGVDPRPARSGRSRTRAGGRLRQPRGGHRPGVNDRRVAGVPFESQGTSLLHTREGRILTIEHYAPATPHQVPSYCGVRSATGLYIRYRTGFSESYNLAIDPYERIDRPHPQAENLRVVAKLACAELPPGMKW